MAGVGRGKNYTDEELSQLCYSVLHVSQDPAIGNGQRAEKFWIRVAEHYNQHKPSKGEVRGRKSLEGKWSDVKHDVSKFIGCFQQVESRQVSGTNEEDSLKLARELYRENHPKSKPFTFEGAWSILKDCPRWRIPVDEMARTKNTTKVTKRAESAVGIGTQSSGGLPEVNSTSDGDTNQAPDGTITPTNVARRPMGNKRAKEEVKRVKINEDVLRMTAEAQKEQAAATKEMAKANFMRARTMENNSTIALLSMPIDNFSPELHSFMSDWKIEEARRLKARMQQSSGEGERQRSPPIVEAPVRAPMNPLPSVRTPLFPCPPRSEGMVAPARINVEETPIQPGVEAGQSVQGLFEGRDEEDEEGNVGNVGEEFADREFHELLDRGGQL